jgi:hypothetical protein
MNVERTENCLWPWVEVLVVICSNIHIKVCPFVLFRLAIVLSVLWFTDSDYPFGIFKLFYISFIVGPPLLTVEEPFRLNHDICMFKRFTKSSPSHNSSGQKTRTKRRKIEQHIPSNELLSRKITEFYLVFFSSLRDKGYTNN